jgi:cytochrome c553
MRNIISALSISSVLFLVSCSSNETANVPKNMPTSVNTVHEADMAAGFQKLETVCFSCHSPNSNAKNKVAPTMAAIKLTYLENSNSKEEFVSKYIHFVSNPQREYALMNHAPDTFGIMPKFEFTEAELNHVASYIYESSLEEEGWYEREFKKEQTKYKADLTKLSYAELGKKFALSTKAVLGKNLKGAIKNNGTSNAVSFCNERAIVLTDSMSVQLHASIKRVSDQPRNPNNQANEAELAYIKSGKLILADGGKMKPLIQEIDGKMVGYYPITTNKMCMQCHGLPNEQIKSETFSKIQSLYPTDAAVGYDENQLRGIWVVRMNKRD